MTTFALIEGTRPRWATVEGLASEREICATPPERDGTPGRLDYQLHVKHSGRHLEVREAEPGRNIPAFCAERHVNPDATFCLFVGSHRAPVTEDEAMMWWEGLLAFLQHQQFADRFGRWPLEAQMSHGKAAGPQLRIDEIAARLGWSTEIASSMFREDGWLTGELPRLVDKGRRLANARTACPRGCQRLHAPFSRRSCERRACRDDCRHEHYPMLRIDCPNRSSVEELVRLEHVRRRHERAFVEELRTQNLQCCGTMRECPLAA
ncbi:E2 domain-containing protein [uncultured Parasphingorhabdus sp.]|uniref:E2 domain-containing protein n=1 Tax=uncultured Parasphingorhabdus sp. TaxID=2709694 RepID=UPI002AA5E375|nr:E2 domain-containing protein [uncultured Parasphingorhabdus sp.]